MVTIGLTGGIASGKSTISRMLAERGAVIIDADRLGHEAYRPGTAAHRQVVEAFGPDVLAPDGEIDRAKLGAKVFGNPDQMRRLTDIVWPAIRALARERIEAERRRGTRVTVLEAAVLVEAGWFDLVDEVWVTVVPPEVARERLMARNGLTPEQAQARIDSQISNEERTRHADVVIDTNRTLAEEEAEVDRLWSQLQARAAGGRGA